MTLRSTLEFLLPYLALGPCSGSSLNDSSSALLVPVTFSALKQERDDVLDEQSEPV